MHGCSTLLITYSIVFLLFIYLYYKRSVSLQFIFSFSLNAFFKRIKQVVFLFLGAFISSVVSSLAGLSPPCSCFTTMLGDKSPVLPSWGLYPLLSRTLLHKLRFLEHTCFLTLLSHHNLKKTFLFCFLFSLSPLPHSNAEFWLAFYIFNPRSFLFFIYFYLFF